MFYPERDVGVLLVIAWVSVIASAITIILVNKTRQITSSLRSPSHPFETVLPSRREGSES